jgi:hypothetical protein
MVVTLVLVVVVVVVEVVVVTVGWRLEGGTALVFCASGGRCRVVHQLLALACCRPWSCAAPCIWAVQVRGGAFESQTMLKRILAHLSVANEVRRRWWVAGSHNCELERVAGQRVRFVPGGGRQAVCACARVGVWGGGITLSVCACVRARWCVGWGHHAVCVCLRVRLRGGFSWEWGECLLDPAASP